MSHFEIYVNAIKERQEYLKNYRAIVRKDVQVYVFGSTLKENTKAWSDIDV